MEQTTGEVEEKDEIDLSEGYIAKLQERAAKKLEGFMKEITGKIISQPLLHWDDTVIMVDTKRSGLRFYGTEKLVMYTAHEKKNKEGLDEDNILNVLSKETIVEHDHNKVNYNDDYIFKNAECNRHGKKMKEKAKNTLSIMRKL